MDKQKILSWFKKGSQKWKIVNHIMEWTKIYNHEIHSAYHICCHTARITEIRHKLEANGHAIIAVPTPVTNENYYVIFKRKV